MRSLPSRLALAAFALLTACEPESPMRAQWPSGDLAVHVSLGASGLRVLSTTRVARGGAPPADPGASTLSYAFTSVTGQPLASGSVADPRAVHVEWFDQSAPQRYETSLDAASLMLRLPVVAGTLTLRDDATSAVLGSAQVTPPETASLPGVIADSLLNTGTDVVGAPVKVVDHGRSAERFDLLFLPEGYTQEQLPQFAADVDRVVAELSARPDYAQHWAQLNVWRIDVRSAETGVSDAAPAPLRNTAFQLRRDATIDRLLVQGDARSTAVATELAARVGADRVIIVANTTYGGAGGAVAVASNDSSLTNVVAHELGHSLFHLADEYFDAANPERTDQWCADNHPTEPNASYSSDRGSIPWGDLIADGTALPTSDDGSGAVGAYAGGDRCRAHRYRPTPNCLMGPDLRQHFCPVCQREMDRFFAQYPVAPTAPTVPSDDASAPPDDASVDDASPAPDATVATDASAPDVTSVPDASGPSCEFTCASRGYVSGQCYMGWFCDGTCVRDTSCVDSSASAPDAGVDASTSDLPCDYTCESQGYAPGQCVSGYYCDGVCIRFTGCT